VTKWIARHERPVVYTFDDRTISDIFSERKPGVILFASKDSAAVISEAFTATATGWRDESLTSIIFSEIPVINVIN
jgi:hypothetical protein